MRVYLDSCIVIYLVEGALPLQQGVAQALRQYSQATFYASDLVRMECRVGPLRRAAGDALIAFDSFFCAITILPLPATVFDLAAELRAQRGLKTPDALHLATAIVHGCDEFWTNDVALSTATSTLTIRQVPDP